MMYTPSNSICAICGKWIYRYGIVEDYWICKCTSFLKPQTITHVTVSGSNQQNKIDELEQQILNYKKTIEVLNSEKESLRKERDDWNNAFKIAFTNSNEDTIKLIQIRKILEEE